MRGNDPERRVIESDIGHWSSSGNASVLTSQGKLFDQVRTNMGFISHDFHF